MKTFKISKFIFFKGRNSWLSLALGTPRLRVDLDYTAEKSTRNAMPWTYYTAIT